MAPSRTAGKAGGGVSFRTKDQISVGLFGPGPATITKSEFAEYDYGGTLKRPAVVWLVTYERPGEESREQVYSIGSGWKIGKNGELLPTNGQTGLPDSSNGAMFAGSLEEAGLDEDLLAALGDDPSVIENTDVELIQKTLAKREGLDEKRKDKEGFDGPKTILLVGELLSDPGKGGKLEGSGKGKGSAKGGKRGKDDEAAERPVRGRRDNQDETEEERPARSAKGGRGRRDAPEENEHDEAAKEALLEALEEKGGKIKIADLETAVAKKLKGNKVKDDILDRVIEDEFLEQEDGWTYDKKFVELAG